MSEPSVLVGLTPAMTAIPLPGASAREQSRNSIVNEAIRFATAGCPGIDEKLTGSPTRVLAALTNSGKADGLIGPESDFQSGPEGIAGVAVWVVAIEGASIPIFGDDSRGDANERSFTFVARTSARELSGCVVRDAPMPTKYQIPSCPLCGGFDFEVLLEGR